MIEGHQTLFFPVSMNGFQRCNQKILLLFDDYRKPVVTLTTVLEGIFERN